MKTARFIVVALLLLPLTTQGQSIRGGAGFLFGGQSVWPGSANAVQQQSGSSGLTGSNRYPLFGAEAYVRYNRCLFGINASAKPNGRADVEPPGWLPTHHRVGGMARRQQHPHYPCHHSLRTARVLRNAGCWRRWLSETTLNYSKKPKPTWNLTYYLFRRLPTR